MTLDEVATQARTEGALEQLRTIETMLHDRLKGTAVPDYKGNVPALLTWYLINQGRLQ